MELKKAKRSAVKIRMSVAAPTGFGKTIAALLIAYGITKDWSKIAVVDTENESASLYSEHTIKKTGFYIGEFNTIPLSPPYTAEKFTQAIKVCEDGGMEVIILDSITHVWSGEGGLLDDNNKLGGSFQSWAKTTPRYQKWLNSILHSSCHVITTNRKKQGYNIITDGGRTKVEKVGMEDEIRNGYDYEMTIAFDIMNKEHLCFASKDRTGLFDGIPEFVITEETGEVIKSWCESGKPALEKDYKEILEICTTLDELKSSFLSIPKEKQGDFVELKDRIKAKLSPDASTSTPPQQEPDPALVPDANPITPSENTPAGQQNLPQNQEIVLLPAITDKMFGQLISRLKLGESDVIDKAKEKYSFSDSQKEVVKSVVIARRPNGVFSGELEVIKEAEFRALMKRMKAEGMAPLVDARKFFKFTPDNEAYINKVIASLDKRAA